MGLPKFKMNIIEYFKKYVDCCTLFKENQHLAFSGDNDSLITGVSSPGKPRRPPSVDTDIVLDGDRPWEKTPSL